MTDTPLKLQIQSVDDISVLSALWQDALINAQDIQFDEVAKEVVVIADRYRWEVADTTQERVLTGLRIGGVSAVQHQNMVKDEAQTSFYNLLHIAYENTTDSAHYVTFTFSAGAALRLTLDHIVMAAADIAPPRPAIATPHHEAEEDGKR